MKLKPKQTVVGPYTWQSRVQRNKKTGADSKEFVNRSIALGVVQVGRDGFVSDLRNEVQAILSRENPIHYLGRKNHPEEIGGNFESYKLEVLLDSWAPETFSNTTTTQPSSETVIPSPANELSIVHQLVNGAGGVAWEDSTALRAWVQGKTPTRYPDNTLDVWGTQVIASVKPTNPVADLSTTLAELASEGKFFELPSEKSTLSGSYLNYQFGMAPTVGFAKDLRKAVRNRDAIIEQYERDAGRRVRRKFATPPVITTTKTLRSSASLYGLGLGAVSSRVASNGTCTVTTTTETSWSFSGCFTYYLPPRGTVGGDIARLDKLYGVNPLNNLFGTGWELTPYSWLVDYKTSAGAYQQNIDSFRDDALVMPWAYVTVYQVVTKEYSWTGLVRKGGSQVSKTYGGVVKTTTIQRRQATPYGFGISTSSLTAKQLSIIAALGISRAS